MNVSVRDFLGSSYNHGDYITVVNNIPSKTPGQVYKTIWEGKYQTMDNHIDWRVYDLEVVKWGIEKNGIVIYVNYNEED